MILSGLKTWLETGELLNATPGSLADDGLRYARSKSHQVTRSQPSSGLR